MTVQNSAAAEQCIRCSGNSCSNSSLNLEVMADDPKWLSLALSPHPTTSLGCSCFCRTTLMTLTEGALCVFSSFEWKWLG